MATETLEKSLAQVKDDVRQVADESRKAPETPEPPANSLAQIKEELRA